MELTELYKFQQSKDNVPSSIHETTQFIPFLFVCILQQLVNQNASGDVTLQYKGTEYSMKVITAEASRLQSLMPEKVAADLSGEVQAPMPGKLHAMQVQVGQQVQCN